MLRNWCKKNTYITDIYIHKSADPSSLWGGARLGSCCRRHGLESCWCFGLFGSFGCFGTGPKHCFLWVPKVTWGILSACFLLGMGSTPAGVRLFRNRSFVFYGFQRSREAFCLRVFCLAWARILLVFRSFRIWGWREFEQPSFGIHAPGTPSGAKTRVLRALILLVFRSFRIWGWRVFEQPSLALHAFQRSREAFFRHVFGLESCWRSGVLEPDQSIVFYGFQRSREAFSACFLLGMGSNLAGVSVSSDLRLTRIWAAIVRNPRSWHPFWYKNSRSSGLDPAGVSVFSDLRLTSLWEAIVSTPRPCLCLAFGCFGTGPKHCFLWVPKGSREAFFRRVFCLAGARLLLEFGCFGTEALFFMGSKGHVRHSVYVFFAWHGLESCWCFGLFGSEADEDLGSHASSGIHAPGTPSGAKTRVLRALILLVFRSFRIWGWRIFEQPSLALHAPACV